jgi:hypothetical protein
MNTGTNKSVTPNPAAIFVVNRFGHLPNINPCIIELINEWKKILGKMSTPPNWLGKIVNLSETNFFVDKKSTGNNNSSGSGSGGKSATTSHHSYWTIPLA